MSKSGIFHKGFQLFLPWVHANGFCQIPVAGVIACDPLAQFGQDVE
jgi:hypothetical protein